MDARKLFSFQMAYHRDGHDHSKFILQPGVELLSYETYEDGLARYVTIFVKARSGLLDEYYWKPLELPANTGDT